MDTMEEKLNSILGNPEMMQKIMAMAQSFGSTAPADQTPPQENTNYDTNTFPNIDLGTIQKISGFIGKTNIDAQQRALLSALSPYLTTDRIQRLEKAMRASKLAKVAAMVLNQSNSQTSFNR